MTLFLLRIVRRLHKALLRRQIWKLGMCPQHGVKFNGSTEQHFSGCYACQSERSAAQREAAYATLSTAADLMNELRNLPK